MVGEQVEGWETQEQVDACLAEVGRTMDQVRRWRREGLLPKVDQVSTAYRGSEVRYPIGTCAQIRAAAVLLNKKKDIKSAGQLLWWHGYNVEERHWRSGLISLASWADRLLTIVKAFSRRDRDWHSETLPERMARSHHSDFIGSRVRRRLNVPQLAALMAITLDVATGEFDHFVSDAMPDQPDEEADRSIAVRAFDLSGSDQPVASGVAFGFESALPFTLKGMSLAFSQGNFEEIAKGPADEIFAARDDVRNAFRVAINLHEALAWIYGGNVFGLRFVDWIARKATPQFVAMMVLGLARIRKYAPDTLRTSEEIVAMTAQSDGFAAQSRQLHRLWREVPEFRHVLSPKRVRDALLDPIAGKRFARDFAEARLRAEARISQEQSGGAIADGSKSIAA